MMNAPSVLRTSYMRSTDCGPVGTKRFSSDSYLMNVSASAVPTTSLVIGFAKPFVSVAPLQISVPCLQYSRATGLSKRLVQEASPEQLPELELDFQAAHRRLEAIRASSRRYLTSVV
jgi:hypothetical protein